MHLYQLLLLLALMTIQYTVARSQTDKCHKQYTLYHGTITEFQAYKQHHGINCNIYVWQGSPNLDQHTPTSHRNDTNNRSAILPHVFSAFLDLPVLDTEASIQSFFAMNKNEDTLMQSQMLRTTDSADFIATQIPEICCLEKMRVFQYCNITDLPP